MKRVAAGCLGLLLAGCLTTPPAPHTAEAPLEMGREEANLWALAEQEVAQMRRTGALLENFEVSNYLRAVCLRLRPDLREGPFAFEVLVVRDPLLNAFAYPHGKLFVHTGLLAAVENEAQIATVLGHEITHFTHRHAFDSARESKANAALFTVLEMGLTGATGYATGLGSVGLMAAVSGYSRNNELEADQVGWYALADAGYAVGESVRVYEILLERLAAEGESEPYFFGSHPKLSERIRETRRLVAAHQSAAANSGEFRGEEVYGTEMAEVFLINAALDLARGEYGQVLRAVERHDRWRPPHAQGCYLRGEALRLRAGEGDPAAGRAALEKAITLDPAHVEARRSLGLLLMERGENEAAAEQFRQVLELAPDHPRRKFIEQYLEQCTS